MSDDGKAVNEGEPTQLFCLNRDCGNNEPTATDDWRKSHCPTCGTKLMLRTAHAASKELGIEIKKDN